MTPHFLRGNVFLKKNSLVNKDRCEWFYMFFWKKKFCVWKFTFNSKIFTIKKEAIIFKTSIPTESLSCRMFVCLSVQKRITLAAGLDYFKKKASHILLDRTVDNNLGPYRLGGQKTLDSNLCRYRSLRLQDLCLGVLSVHGNELRLFRPRQIPIPYY